MNVKGGYSLVDCTGLDFGNLTKVDGIYNKMLTAYKSNKLVILEHCSNGNAKFTPIPCFIATETVSNKIVIVATIMNLPYRISDDDTIVQE